MFFEMLQIVISFEDMSGFYNIRSKIRSATKGFPGKSQQSGLLLWLLICERIFPLTKICTEDIETGSNNNKKMKLKLADSFVDSLTTHMNISANDARTFVENQLANFDADNKTTTNDKSSN